MTISLGPRLLAASSDLPADGPTEQARWAFRRGPRLSAYLVLLPVGFAVPPVSPRARCALTAPFHPYQAHGQAVGFRRYLSVALSVGLPRLGVTKHRVLCSSDFPHPSRQAQGAITSPTAAS